MLVALYVCNVCAQAKARAACKQDAVVPGYPEPTRVSGGEDFYDHCTLFKKKIKFEVDMDLRREVEEVEAVISQKC